MLNDTVQYSPSVFQSPQFSNGLPKVSTNLAEEVKESVMRFLAELAVLETQEIRQRREKQMRLHELAEIFESAFAEKSADQ
jgi:hypothetical protein